MQEQEAADGRVLEQAGRLAAMVPFHGGIRAHRKPQTFRDGEVDGDDEDRHQREGGGEGQVARRTLLHVDHLTYVHGGLPMMPGMM